MAKLDSYMQENELGYCLTPYRKVNSKCIKDLNVSHETIKLLEDNIGKHLLNISMSNFFLNPFPRERETKAKMNSWDYIKLKSFCAAKASTEQKGILQYGRIYL